MYGGLWNKGISGPFLMENRARRDENLVAGRTSDFGRDHTIMSETGMANVSTSSEIFHLWGKMQNGGEETRRVTLAKTKLLKPVPCLTSHQVYKAQ